MKSIKAPLVEAIQKHIMQKPVSFHVPGHKNGAVFPNKLFDDFRDFLPYDVTELEGLDDLHSPTGAILEAQRLAASFYGAAHTFFLVGGSTVGNLAMVYALCEPGDSVFVQRNAHKSVFNALKLARVTPIFLSPEYDKETGHPLGVTVETFNQAVHLYPNAKALLLTYPNYYGVSLDLEKLIKLAKSHGLHVLVDEAHGAHFSISALFPPSSLSLGADVVVQSAHKLLPALTMGSYLHVHSSKKHYIGKLQEALGMFQSSSPSYPIMASLDGARAFSENVDVETIISILAGVRTFKGELATIEQIEVVEWPKSYLCDPLKVTIKSRCELSGYQIQQMLAEVGLYTELADPNHVLFVLGLQEIMNRDMIIKKISSVLSSYRCVVKKGISISLQEKSVSTLSLSLEEVNNMPSKKVSPENAIGSIAAEAIIPYPPGIPIILAGERITLETIRYLMELERAGSHFQGYETLQEGILIVELED